MENDLISWMRLMTDFEKTDYHTVGDKDVVRLYLGPTPIKRFKSCLNAMKWAIDNQDLKLAYRTRPIPHHCDECGRMGYTIGFNPNRTKHPCSRGCVEIDMGS